MLAVWGGGKALVWSIYGVSNLGSSGCHFDYLLLLDRQSAIWLKRPGRYSAVRTVFDSWRIRNSWWVRSVRTRGGSDRAPPPRFECRVGDNCSIDRLNDYVTPFDCMSEPLDRRYDRKHFFAIAMPVRLFETPPVWHCKVVYVGSLTDFRGIGGQKILNRSLVKRTACSKLGCCRQPPWKIRSHGWCYGRVPDRGSRVHQRSAEALKVTTVESSYW